MHHPMKWSAIPNTINTHSVLCGLLRKRNSELLSGLCSHAQAEVMQQADKRSGRKQKSRNHPCAPKCCERNQFAAAFSAEIFSSSLSAAASHVVQRNFTQLGLFIGRSF